LARSRAGPHRQALQQTVTSEWSSGSAASRYCSHGYQLLESLLKNQTHREIQMLKKIAVAALISSFAIASFAADKTAAPATPAAAATAAPAAEAPKAEAAAPAKHMKKHHKHAKKSAAAKTEATASPK
jgi:hypothetical protein